MPLVTGLEHQLSVRAVLAGAMPGAVFVDDATRPSAVFLHSPEGNFVGGDPTNERFVADLRTHLAATFAPARDGELVMCFDRDSWAAVVRLIVPDLDLGTVPRRHYLVRAEATEPPGPPGPPRPLPPPPPGYRIAPIDPALLRDRQVPGDLRQWMDGNWGGEEDFLARGFGAVALQGDTIASWSLADCVVGDRAEIGIHTAPEHRRRGLATQVTAAAVAIAFERGVTEVGWHCDEDNVGSYRTAESAGFTLRRRYHLLVGRP